MRKKMKRKTVRKKKIPKRKMIRAKNQMRKISLLRNHLARVISERHFKNLKIKIHSFLELFMHYYF